MNNSSIYKSIIERTTIFVVLSIIYFSCTYAEIDPTCTKTLPDTISFSKNIIPILNTNCNMNNCHSSPSPAGFLDLSPSVAYSKLLKKGSGYVDTLNPQKSILYIQITSTMPPTGKMDPCDIALILKWMEQNAKNN
jgi:hypothetical protein